MKGVIREIYLLTYRVDGGKQRQPKLTAGFAKKPPLHSSPGMMGPPKDREEALRVPKRLPEFGVSFTDTAQIAMGLTLLSEAAS
ncbi:hypothetical protein [Leptolyngbya sp. BC1307]|uniref:hypothetical protein n=1 Tax=Leptolyngbya sp. BC1307 TaxID=2029589 RepID=UPI000EFBA6FA|nr:hypothetical protein [Leptolyngbya sp. BC1307]